MNTLPTRGRIAAVLALLALGSSLRAQDPDPLAKLDPASRRAVELLIDSARAEGLPTRQLISTVQHGNSKHVDGPRIAAVVRTVFLSFREARVALGPNFASDELEAAAAALQAGIPTDAVTELRSARRGKSITVPLVVVADLVTRGVPRDAASSAILQLWLGGAGDADLLTLPQRVQTDILSGATPGDALQHQTKQIPIRLPPSKLP